MIMIQKLNVVKEIDERDFQEFKEKGFKEIDTTTNLFAPDFEKMSDDEIAEYARLNEKDISKAKDRTAAIKILQK